MCILGAIISGRLIHTAGVSVSFREAGRYIWDLMKVN